MVRKHLTMAKADLELTIECNLGQNSFHGDLDELGSWNWMMLSLVYIHRMQNSMKRQVAVE